MVKVRQAFDHAPIGELPADDEAALERKLAAAAAVFKDRDHWPQPFERTDVLRRLGELLRGQKDAFARLIAQEGGKPLRDAIVEVDRAIDGVRDAIHELRNLAGKEIPMGLTAASVGRLAFTTYEPIGVVAAISAFNHPLNLIVHQVAPAIAVGCPIIVKPASATPLCCFKFVELVHKAGLPEAWCQTFLPEKTGLAERFATDPRIAFLSFIGSSRVGWSLRSKLAPGTRCALEHGGVAPVIVDRSANLDKIIEPLVKGGYYHAGQVCVSVQRIFVHGDLEAALVERLAARVKKLVVGDPLMMETEVGPLIAPSEADRVRQWIDEGVSGGGTLVVGGERLSETTLAPAVVREPPPGSRLATAEVFGPVTCTFRFTDLDEAIGRANSLPFAFQASVFSTDINAALHAAERLDGAAIMINDHTAFRTDWMPFAGLKHSGYGIGGIPYTMREMCHAKMIVLKRSS